MSEFSGLYDVRDMVNEDKNFILATFLRGLYYGDSWFSTISKDVFMENYKPVAEQLITSSKYAVKIACLREDPSVILGYSIVSADYQGIVWVYVKSAWRTKGIARRLTPQWPAYVTHLTALGKSLINKFETKPVFNPFK